MNTVEFEAFVREAVARVLEGGRLEDSRFEAKRDITDITRMAERLAGHANAARGSSIIWLIGLDEDSAQIKRSLNLDLADLIPRVERKFDEREAPRVVRDHRFTFGNRGTVLAIEFDTSFPPYVVRRDTTDDWEFAVPWRSGTRTRSARRHELRRLLIQQSQVPAVRPLQINVVAQHNDHLVVQGRLLFSLAAGTPPVFLPYDDMTISLSTPSTTNYIDVKWGELRTDGATTLSGPIQYREKLPEYAHATEAGIAVNWVGSVPFGAAGDLFAPWAVANLRRTKTLRFRYEAKVLDSEGVASAEARLFKSTKHEHTWTVAN